MATDQEILGRDDVNDLEAILAITNTDVDEVDPHRRGQRRRHLHVGLREGRPAGAQQALREGQDVAVERRDRPRLVDRRRPREDRRRCSGLATPASVPVRSSTSRARPSRTVGDKEWTEFGVESQNWRLSQFMHGEQGALLCTAKIVETVPWIDAKYYAVDPGDGRGPSRRGVRQVPRRRSSTGHYPINAHLRCCSTTSSTTAAGT